MAHNPGLAHDPEAFHRIPFQVFQGPEVFALHPIQLALDKDVLVPTVCDAGFQVEGVLDHSGVCKIGKGRQVALFVLYNHQEVFKEANIGAVHVQMCRIIARFCKLEGIAVPHASAGSIQQWNIEGVVKAVDVKIIACLEKAGPGQQERLAHLGMMEFIVRYFRQRSIGHMDDDLHAGAVFPLAAGEPADGVPGAGQAVIFDGAKAGPFRLQAQAFNGLPGQCFQIPGNLPVQIGQVHQELDMGQRPP